MRRNKITKPEIHTFLSQFATLLTAGVSIINSLETLEATQNKQNIRILIYSIKRSLQSGNSFFTTLKSHPNYFNELCCHLIDLGEHTGKLAKIIESIVAYQSRLEKIKRKFKTTLIYPLFILVTAIVVSIGLLIFVVPQFAELFTTTQVKLPLITQIIFTAAANVNFVLLSLIIFIFILFLIYKYCFYHLPIVKTLYSKFCLTHFCRSLELGLTSGLVLHVALRFAANGAGQKFLSLESSLQAGNQFHDALEMMGTLPPLLIQFVKVGETSGKLGPMLGQAADVFEAELYEELQQISILFEPLIILLLGVLIGGLVVSMYLPIFNLGSTI